MKRAFDICTIDAGEALEETFAKWLSIITLKEISDKLIVENACKDEEEIMMAVATLARQWDDKIKRQAYQRRQDEIYFFNKALYEGEKFRQKAEQEQRRAEQAEQRIEQEQRRAEQAEAESKKLRQELEKLQSGLATDYS